MLGLEPGLERGARGRAVGRWVGGPNGNPDGWKGGCIIYMSEGKEGKEWMRKGNDWIGLDLRIWAGQKGNRRRGAVYISLLPPPCMFTIPFLISLLSSTQFRYGIRNGTA